MSILTRSHSKSSAPARQQQPNEPTAMEKHLDEMKAMQAEVARLGAELSAAHADLRAAHADAERERARYEAEHAMCASLREQLTEEVEARGRVAAELAGVRAQADGLQAQLATERAARAALATPLEQAIAAASKPPAAPGPQEPRAYEIVVQARDMNERLAKAVLRPVKAEG